MFVLNDVIQRGLFFLGLWADDIRCSLVEVDLYMIWMRQNI